MAERSDKGIKRVEGDLRTFTVSLNTVRDADVIEAIDSSEELRAITIRKLLKLGVKLLNKGKK
jgi:hypothetical protein